MGFSHTTVLLTECIELLSINPDGIYIDGTAGGGGHSLEIAKKLSPQGKLISLDVDPQAIKAATDRLSNFSNAQIIRSNFSEVDKVLKELEIPEVDGMMLDLGVSSHQLDTPSRGFSYHNDAPLDMRMSDNGVTAYDVVNDYTRQQLSDILRKYGEEKFAWQIAGGIERKRQNSPIKTTLELVDVIASSVPAAARRDGHPARRTFQAIRIEVNRELESLEVGVRKGFESLAVGGRLVIITFHSLEDKIVKNIYREYLKGCTCPDDFPICICGKTPRGKLVNRKPILPSEQEIESNRRSRSARIRSIEKIAN